MSARFLSQATRVAIGVVLVFGAAIVFRGQSNAPVEIVGQAAKALGGMERIRSTKNMTLVGFGQYASQFGGGNITGSPDAPQKYIAANDFRRVYDLEHDRFQQLERQNDLFPFMITTGHNFTLRDMILDGDIAYNVNNGKVVRVARWSDGDGVHMRRMWMLNNPVALLRAMLDPQTKLSAPRHDGNYAVVDVTLKQGDKFSAGFSADYLPAWVRWSSPQVDLGEVTFTTHFAGYASFEGLLLPLGYDTRLDWRNVDYFKLYVDHYSIDGQIADLQAPPEVHNVPEPPSYPPPAGIKSVKVADHLWRISPSGTTVVEFKNHLTLFELDSGSWQSAKALLVYARTLVPGKPITQVIVTHHHFDHTSGLRQAVAEGLTIISRRGNEGIFREMVTHPDPDFPDELAMSPKPLKFIAVDEKLELSDETMKLDVYWVRNNIHMVDAIFAYAPAQKVIMEGDIATAAWDYNFWPDTLRDAIDYYKLDVEKDSPVHSVWPEHPDVLTMSQVNELIKGGVKRGRELCASHLAKGDYFAGCPIWSNRY